MIDEKSLLRIAFSVDYDDTAMTENDGKLSATDAGKYEFNEKLIPHYLWCEVNGIDTYLTTKRKASELLLIMKDEFYQTKTLKYYFSQLQQYGLKQPQIVTFYDPISKEYFKKIEKLEEEIITILPQIISKIKEDSKNFDEDLILQQNINQRLIKTSEYINICSKWNEEELELEKEYSINNENQSYKAMNSFKAAQFRYIHMLLKAQYPDKNTKIIHLDDDKEIIKELLNALQPTNAENKNLQFNKDNVVPVHLWRADKTKAWQRKVAEELGLHQAAEKMLFSADIKDITQDKKCLAVLLYLCQNHTVLIKAKEEYSTLVAMINKFVTDYKQGKFSLKLTDKMIEFFNSQTKNLCDSSCNPSIAVSQLLKPTLFTDFKNFLSSPKKPVGLPSSEKKPIKGLGKQEITDEIKNRNEKIFSP